MKFSKIYVLLALLVGVACTDSEPEIEINDTNFPFRLQFGNKEGADLPDAEDYDVEIEFADFLGDLPSDKIVLTYSLSGEGDFAGIAIDEVAYEYEDENLECVFIREASFDGNTITIPVDADLGTVPEKIEIVLTFNLTGDEATEGTIEFEITDLTTNADVLFNAISTFEYEILDNDLAGEWVFVFNESSYDEFVAVLGIVSTDLVELDKATINEDMEMVVEFEFEEMKFEIETTETESKCEDGETEDSEIAVEIEANYEAEDGEFEFEGEYVNEDGEALDYLMTGEYTIDEETGNLTLTITKIINEDGDVIFDDTYALTLERD